MSAHHVKSKALAYNALFNFAGQVAVAAIAFFCLPLIVRGLGFSGYGLLAIALTVFGSFGLLDMGLGRATTKFVSEILGNKNLDELADVVWTSLCLQVAIGLVSGLAIILAAGAIAGTMQIEPAMAHETRQTIVILGVAAPIVLITSTLRGALEGAQRFDLVNVVKVALNTCTYLVPLAGAHFHLPVPTILLGMLLVRTLAACAYAVCCLRTFGPMYRPRLHPGTARKIIKYSGWVAVSNVVVALLVQTDKYFIAALASVAAVSYYSVSFELLFVLWIVPTGITTAIFPAFSSLGAGNIETLSGIYFRSIKFLLLLLGPACLFFAFFAHEILLYWQGIEVADHGAPALRFLALGVLINSLSWVPSNLLSGLGRPDIITKVQLLQVPFYLVGMYYLVKKFGISGAAGASLIRGTAESLLIFVLVRRHVQLNLKPELARGIATSVLGLAALAVSFWVVSLARIPAVGMVASVGFLTTAFVAWAWYRSLDPVDRTTAVAMIPGWMMR